MNPQIKRNQMNSSSLIKYFLFTVYSLCLSFCTVSSNMLKINYIHILLSSLVILFTLLSIFLEIQR